MAVAMCVEWLELMFKPDRLGKSEIDLTSIKSPNVREALNQIRKGVNNYKQTMKSEKKLADSEFEELKDFASYKMETLTTLAMAFIPLDEEGCTFLTAELLKSVEKLRVKMDKKREKEAKQLAKQTKSV